MNDEPRPRLRVAVLFGGRSGEHAVSLQSARAVMDNLRAAGHAVVPIGISREGRWMVSGDPLQALSSGTSSGEQGATLLPEPGHSELVRVEGSGRVLTRPGDAEVGQFDVVFPVLHGTYGEDGTVQGLLELADIPYVGSGVLGSALGMDKEKQKALWRGLGLPVVDWVAATRRQVETNPRAVMDEVERALGYPCFTKPANAGSSVGVSKARTPAELRAGLHDAARYDHKILVERAVDARELEVSVLGNEQPVASVVGEILPGAEFYSYRAKYLDSDSRPVIPAEISAAMQAELQRIAVRAFQAVDAAGLARVDFFLERGGGAVYLNEINTMPGFTRISMYPRLWEASGLSFPELVDRLVRLALERHRERARTETSYNPDSTGAQTR